MTREEAIQRLKIISEYAVYSAGSPPRVMSLDDGIAVREAVEMLERGKGEVLTITTKDIETLLEKATEMNRDLRLTFSSDGSYDVCFDIPSKSTLTFEPDAGKGKE